MNQASQHGDHRLDACCAAASATKHKKPVLAGRPGLDQFTSYLPSGRLGATPPFTPSPGPVALDAAVASLLTPRMGVAARFAVIAASSQLSPS